MGITLEVAEEHDEVDRCRLQDEITRTAAVATLVSGFALGSLRSNRPTNDDNVELAIYVTAMIAVHLCTCAALMSLLLAREVNGIPRQQLTEWFHKSTVSKLLPVPLQKLLAGAICYLLNVLLISWRDLDGPVNATNTFTGNTGLKWFGLFVGGGSVLSVVMTCCLIMLDKYDPDYHKKYN